MNRINAHLIKTAILLCLACLFSCNEDQVTLQSLLTEMPNRENLTIFADKEFVHKQFSSYNRASVSPLDSGWFANQDMSHFLRVEDNHGRREFVMLDADGPGVIVRWWMTFYKAQNGIIRVYIDDDPVPALQGRPDSLLSGSMLAGYPLSASVQEGAPPGEEGRDYDHNLYFPVPFSKHCKVTYECDSLRRLYNYEGIAVPKGYWWPDVFYNIGCRLYNKNTCLESFTKEISDKQKALTEQTGKALLSGEVSSTAEYSFDKQIQPNDSLVVQIKENQSAVNNLSVILDTVSKNQAFRSVVLKIAFDDLETVWVPVGEFFGCGYTFSPHTTWMNRSDEKGKLESFWIMPFQKKCMITLVNYGNEIVQLSGFAGIINYPWKPESMYFGASWHEYYRINSRDANNSPFDLNLIDIQGKGVYVGDQIALFNNTWQWWGEGDEKIFVDGESFPSIFGSGTEDYYGYSFGRQDAFSHPFISQPIGTGNMSYGTVLNIRQRSLDAIPFHSSISVNLELWHWAQVLMNYALTSYYYIMPPFTINIKPDIESVQHPVSITKEDFNMNR